MPFRPRPVAAVDLNPIRRKRGRPAGSKNRSDNARKRESKWILKEKKNLVEGLKIHSPEDITSLSQYVPNKTHEEIEAYLEKQKNNIRIKNRVKTKVPIEHWSVLVNDLVLPEKRDYTENLATVMSVAANFEDHPTPDATTPDYAAIYRCLAAVLQGSELPELGSLECGVILDLLHSMVDTLRSHNTEEQRQIMLWKYKLLRGKVDQNNTFKDLERCRKAIINDFSDFTGPRNETASASGTTSDQQGPSRQTSTLSQSQPLTQQSSNSVNQPQSTSQQSSHTINQSDSGLHPSEQEKEEQLERIGLIPSPRKELKSNSENNVPNIDSESQVPGVGPESRVQGVGPSSDETAGPKAGKIQIDVQEPELDEQVTEPKSKEIKRKRGRKPYKPKPAEEEEKIPKKPKMFTLNPFCVPVNLLKLQPKSHLQIRVADTEADTSQLIRKGANSQTPLAEKPTKISTFTSQSSNLSGMVPGAPGCSTRHTTVMLLESPYRGKQPVFRRKISRIESKTTEVVVVTPGYSEPENKQNLINKPSLQEVIKKGKEVVQVSNAAVSKFKIVPGKQQQVGVPLTSNEEKGTSTDGKSIKDSSNQRDSQQNGANSLEERKLNVDSESNQSQSVNSSSLKSNVTTSTVKEQVVTSLHDSMMYVSSVMDSVSHVSKIRGRRKKRNSVSGGKQDSKNASLVEVEDSEPVKKKTKMSSKGKKRVGNAEDVDTEATVKNKPVKRGKTTSSKNVSKKVKPSLKPSLRK